MTAEATERPAPIRAFTDAALHPVMMSNVEKSGYSIPTPIQAYTIPAVLKGRDVIATAQTGKVQEWLYCSHADNDRFWQDCCLLDPLLVQVDG